MTIEELEKKINEIIKTKYKEFLDEMTCYTEMTEKEKIELEERMIKTGIEIQKQEKIKHEVDNDK